MVEPLGDIEVLSMEKKNHLGHDKEVVNLPNGYKILSNPILHNYLIYKRSKSFLNIVKSRLEQSFKPVILEEYPSQKTINLELIPSFCFPEGIKLSK